VGSLSCVQLDDRWPPLVVEARVCDEAPLAQHVPDEHLGVIHNYRRAGRHFVAIISLFSAFKAFLFTAHLVSYQCLLVTKMYNAHPAARAKALITINWSKSI